MPNTTASASSTRIGRYWSMALPSGNRHRSIAGDELVASVQHIAQDREEDPGADERHEAREPNVTEATNHHDADDRLGGVELRCRRLAAWRCLLRYHTLHLHDDEVL